MQLFQHIHIMNLHAMNLPMNFCMRTHWNAQNQDSLSREILEQIKIQMTGHKEIFRVYSPNKKLSSMIPIPLRFVKLETTIIKL